MNETGMKQAIQDMAMRRALWFWLMAQAWHAGLVGDAPDIRPDYRVMSVSDDAVRADLRRILLPRRKFLGLF